MLRLIRRIPVQSYAFHTRVQLSIPNIVTHRLLSARAARTKAPKPFYDPINTKSHLTAHLLACQFANPIDPTFSLPPHECIELGIEHFSKSDLTAAHSFARSVATSHSPQLACEMLSNAAVAIAQHGNIPRALQVFQSIESLCGITPSSSSYSKMSHWLLHSGRIESALVLLQEMKTKGVQPYYTHYTSMILALCKQGSINPARELLDDLIACSPRHQSNQILNTKQQQQQQQQQQQPRPTVVGHLNQMNHAFAHLIRAIGTRGDTEAAERLLREARQLSGKPYYEVMCAMMDVYSRKGDVARVARLVDQVVRKFPMHKHKPFDILITAHANNRDAQQAWQVLSQMHERGIAPASTTYEKLLNCYNDERSMRHVAHKARYMGFNIDKHLYAELLRVRSKNNMESTLQSLLCEIEQRGIRLPPSRLARLLNAQMRVGKKHEAVMDTVRSDCMHRNNYPRSCVEYNVIISNLCRSRKYEQVFETLDTMKAEGISPSITTYAMLIKAHCKLGQPKLALELLNTIKSAGMSPTIATLSPLLRYFIKNHDPWYIDELLDELQKVRTSPCRSLYRTLVSHFGMAGDSVRVARLLSDMMKDGSRVELWALNSLLVAHSKTGSLWEVEQVFQEIKKLEHSAPNLVTYSALIEAYCKHHQYDKALEALTEIAVAGIRYSALPFNLFLKWALRSSQQQLVRLAVNLMDEVGVACNTQTYNLLLANYVRQGNIAEAQSIVDAFDRKASSETKPDKVTYYLIIKLHILQGNLEDALAVMLNSIERGITPSVRMIESMLTCFIEADSFDSAKQLLLEIRKYNQAISSHSLQTLIQSNCKYNKPEIAAKVLRLAYALDSKPVCDAFDCIIDSGASNPTPLPDSRALNTYVKALCIAGELSKATKVLDALRAFQEYELSTELFNFVLNSLLQSRRYNLFDALWKSNCRRDHSLVRLQCCALDEQSHSLARQRAEAQAPRGRDATEGSPLNTFSTF
jgi:pentatricopeptide repeat protein